MFYYSLIFPQRAVREVQIADNLSQAMNVLAPRSTRSAPEKAQKVQVLWAVAAVVVLYVPAPQIKQSESAS